jgi:hypothetical protein
MVIDHDGALRPGQEAYDKKVAGVVSGGGDFKPGIVLGRQASDTQRIPIALVGKVYCKVDACYSAIEIGDLLTTSQTPGHAMKVTDPLKALGSVIGITSRAAVLLRESGQNQFGFGTVPREGGGCRQLDSAVAWLVRCA